MKNINLSSAQHELIEKLYSADHVFTKSEFNNPKEMITFLSDLEKMDLIQWGKMGDWEITISEKGKAYYDSYLEQIRKDAVGERRHQETLHQSKRQNTIAILALIVSALSMAISILLPLLLHYLQK